MAFFPPDFVSSPKATAFCPLAIVSFPKAVAFLPSAVVPSPKAVAFFPLAVVGFLSEFDPKAVAFCPLAIVLFPKAVAFLPLGDGSLPKSRSIFLNSLGYMLKGRGITSCNHYLVPVHGSVRRPCVLSPCRSTSAYEQRAEDTHCQLFLVSFIHRHMNTSLFFMFKTHKHLSLLSFY